MLDETTHTLLGVKLSVAIQLIL